MGRVKFCMSFVDIRIQLNNITDKTIIMYIGVVPYVQYVGFLFHITCESKKHNSFQIGILDCEVSNCCWENPFGFRSV